jgi:membrane associated rhomboid family serine protease
MIPISDDNPARLRPVISWSLVAACIAVFLWELSIDDDVTERLFREFGFVPRTFFGDALGAAGSGLPWLWFTPVTSMFLHGGLLHLGGNLLYLWIFGNNVEDAMGHGRFLGFYLSCGIAAALAEGFVNPQSELPMVGASGAVSGVLAAYVMIYPRARITVIVPLGIYLYPTKISAFYVVGFWFMLQILNGFLVPPETPGTAWWAHVGGFLMGVLLTPILSQFPLFGRHRRGPWR